MGNRIKGTVCRNQKGIYKGTNIKNLLSKTTNKG